MKIKSFGINNFRGISGGIDNNIINFNDSNTIFIFGQNNVGKSTFLKAYEFFYNSINPQEDDLYCKDTSLVIQFELCLELDEFDFRKDSIKNKSEGLKKWLDSDNLLRIKREISSQEDKGKIKFDKAKNYTLNPSTGEWESKNYGGIGLDTVFQSSLPQPIFIKAMPTEEEVENIINEILSKKAMKALEDKERDEFKSAQAKIRELQNKMYNPYSIKDYKDEVNKHFQKLFPETRIELEDEDKISWTESKFGKKFKIHFEKVDGEGEKNINIPTSYSKIGHGAIRSAIFSLMLMKDIAEEFEREDNRKDYLVLFEEPELFLHPKLMYELRKLIYKVSEDDYPYQVLCASHSPQMIDISKPKSSLVRMIKDSNNTLLHQVDDNYLIESKGISTKEELKQEMQEILRFNPYICESFYSDEVILIEGPTEEIILRGYLGESKNKKDLFIVNCGTVNNIPFYQKIFSKFGIKYHVICDTDNANDDGLDENGIIKFTGGIQASIYNQFILDKQIGTSINLFFHHTTFEPAHEDESIPEELRYISSNYNSSDGKPYNANLYWKNILSVNLGNPDIQKVPIISHINKINTL